VDIEPGLRVQPHGPRIVGRGDEKAPAAGPIGERRLEQAPADPGRAGPGMHAEPGEDPDLLPPDGEGDAREPVLVLGDQEPFRVMGEALGELRSHAGITVLAVRRKRGPEQPRRPADVLFRQRPDPHVVTVSTPSSSEIATSSE